MSVRNVSEKAGVPPSSLRHRLLEQRIKNALHHKEMPSRIKPLDRSGPAPLSFAQQRLWFLDQLHPESPLYNMTMAARLEGPLRVAVLRHALATVIERHQILRTRFISIEGEPWQETQETSPFEMPVIDLSGPNGGGEDGLWPRLREESRRSFNLAADLPVRAILFRLGPEEHVLFLNIHHIACDAYSFGILFKEVSALYEANLAGTPARLPELPIQYADYAAWQRRQLETVMQTHLAYWKEQLAGAPELLELPADRPRPATPTFRGGLRTWQLPTQITAGLQGICRREHVTLFMLMLAAFQILLYRLTRQKDILVGAPITGRTQMETEELIGFFINTLVLRSQLSGDLRFREFLHRVRAMTLDAYAHQDVPFEKLVEELRPERTSSATPFIQVMLVVQPGVGQNISLPGLKLSMLPIGTGTAKFDLLLTVNHTAGDLTMDLEYNSDLFDASTIDRWLSHLEVLLSGVIADPEQRLFELPLLTDTERQTQLVDWNNTRTDYPRDRCIHELLEEQARLRPNAIAVSFGKRQLTYRELNSRANQLAHHLRNRGVQTGNIVALCLERSLEMIVCLAGILKAGAAYAALDPSWPRERLMGLLRDLQAPVLLTYRPVMKNVPEVFQPNSSQPVPSIICLDEERLAISNESPENPECLVFPEDLAYISFTSGSTGRPKGVCVPHRGVVRLVRNTSYACFSPEEVFLQLAPLSFDASTFEVWGCLLNGARLVVFPPQVPSLTELTDFIHKNGITTAWFTSGLFHQLVEEQPEGLKPLRQILTGGDVLSPPHIVKALRLLPEQRLINGYGPTENTTFTTCYTIPHDYRGDHSVPIGRPIANTICYVLDEYCQPVPIGVPGELYAGGDGLALGYFNRPELTAEKFVANPFLPGSRLYRTGDQVRYLPDGSLEFLGRADLQVKVRGFRVELGEVESHLHEHPQLRGCAVVAQPDTAGTKQLVAYCVPRETPAPTLLELQQFLAERLPEFMVPAQFIMLHELPLSANGKVDRAALPVPQSNREPETSKAAPRDDTERQLQQLWEKVLNVSPVGIHDKFFALGGHSLLAVRLLAQVEKTFGQKLTVASLFQHPTIEQFAVLLRGSGPARSHSAIVEIQPLGGHPPLLLVHGAGGGMFWGYGNLARHLGPDQPVFAFKSRGLDGAEELDRIEDLADAYLAGLRTFQPHGPYYLGGYCFGGLVAYEMARRLHALGEPIAHLALINTSVPNSSYTCFRWTPRSALKVGANVTLRAYYTLRHHPEYVHRFVRWKSWNFFRRVRGRVRSTHPNAMLCDPDEMIDLTQFSEDQRKVWEKHLYALTQYTPQTYPGRITLFRSPVHLLYCSFDHQYGWGEYALGGVDVKIIPGAHEMIMEEPGVVVLAETMRQCLAQARASHRAVSGNPAG